MKPFPATCALLLLLAVSPGVFPARGAARSSGQPSVVRVSVTSQAYDFRRPWTKKAPYSLRALGAVLPNKCVLVTAEFVANHTYLELEKPESGAKTTARVECVDYQANLALLKASDDKFFAGFKPLEMTSAGSGDRLTVLQLEPNGSPVTTEGVMSTVAVTRMPHDDLALLIYRATVALQFYDASITMPVLKGRKLAGMMVRYDRRTQNAEIIAAPVIEHFLKAAAKPPYRGFPRAGFSASATRDPQLRRYARLNPDPPAGVFVTDVVKNSPADQAGLKVGDVLAAVDNHVIDQDGNYNDPIHGRIPFTHLLSTRHYDGDTVKFKILRLGQLDTLSVTLRQRPAE
ncbi:MAG: PDZ domain-containing protein, partial [Verrucomicrobiae bacterium]|nr:PDZ domain-containing protein [Verrucomicrobiae bacterium]